jgi:hypothetical protein
MGSMKPPLRLCSTDQCHILNSEVSISHCLNILKLVIEETGSQFELYNHSLSFLLGVAMTWRVPPLQPFSLNHKFELDSASLKFWT